MSLRSSVFHYGFFDENEVVETSMVLHLANKFEFGAPAEQQQCTEGIMAGLAALPSDRVAYFPYDIQLIGKAAIAKVRTCCCA